MFPFIIGFIFGSWFGIGIASILIAAHNADNSIYLEDYDD